jgi:hypothetical protein
MDLQPPNPNQFIKPVHSISETWVLHTQHTRSDEPRRWPYRWDNPGSSRRSHCEMFQLGIQYKSRIHFQEQWSPRGNSSKWWRYDWGRIFRPRSLSRLISLPAVERSRLRMNRKSLDCGKVRHDRYDILGIRELQLSSSSARVSNWCIQHFLPDHCRYLEDIRRRIESRGCCCGCHWGRGYN